MKIHGFGNTANCTGYVHFLLKLQDPTSQNGQVDFIEIVRSIVCTPLLSHTCLKKVCPGALTFEHLIHVVLLSQNLERQNLMVYHHILRLDVQFSG